MDGLNDTRTRGALAPLVEAIEGDLNAAADEIEGVASFLAHLRESVIWLHDTATAINGVHSALEAHADALRKQAIATRQRLTGEVATPPITEQKDRDLTARIRLERAV